MKRPLVIHPFLFAIFPIFYLFLNNIDELPLNELFIPITGILFFTFFFLILLSFAFKDKKKAGLFVSFFLLFFFSYGYFFDLVEKLSIGGFVFGRHRYFFPAWCMLMMYGAYFIIKIRRNLDNLTAILNVMAASLVIISVINITTYELNERIDIRHNVPKENIAGDLITLDEPNTRPDIYYIILDRYANSTTLEELFNYDNSEFIDYLTEKGFYVASESRCNYPYTALSLASSLNMRYFDFLAVKEATDRIVPSELLQDYKIWRFLKSRGYKFIHCGHLHGGTQRNRYADINLFRGMGIFPYVLLHDASMFRPFSEVFFFRHTMRQRTLDAFVELAKVPDINGPKFVFAHMYVPHPPYVFDREGEMPTNSEIEARSDKENYLNQLIFGTKKVRELIDVILSKSKKPPIVVLQADEGPALPELHMEGEETSTDILRKRIRILNAYYLPNVDKNVLYASITPVNSFRLIFNLYFNTNFELLPDESYIKSKSEKYPCVFLNVTAKVKYK